MPLERFKNKSKILDSALRRLKLDKKEAKKRKEKKAHKSPKKKMKLEHKMREERMRQLEKFLERVENCEKLVHERPAELSDIEVELFESLMSRELDPNGGASVLVIDQTDLEKRLELPGQKAAELMRKFAGYFLNCVYSESENRASEEVSKENVEMPALIKKRHSSANYVLGVVRGSASSMPDLIDYFADHFPQMIVKSSLLANSKEVTTLKISEYRKHVNSTYLNGTFRFGPLLQTSLVGVRNEEIGDYFPEFIEQFLEGNEFLRQVMPWGPMSVNANMNPMNSDDGPIFWARPGEQMIPTSSLNHQQFLNSNNNANLASANQTDKKRK